LLIYLLIHNFVAQPFEVRQSSMVPTIVSGEYILIDKLTIRWDNYDYGEVIVFEPPGDSALSAGGIPFIKRIIGLPGDTVTLENGRVFITQPDGDPVRIEEPYIRTEEDGRPVATLCPAANCTGTWEVGDGEYFVMGDNRGSSQDSRAFGPVSEDLILGRAWLRYFPLDRVGLIETPDHPSLADRDSDEG
jgi:signal peptidase I